MITEKQFTEGPDNQLSYKCITCDHNQHLTLKDVLALIDNCLPTSDSQVFANRLLAKLGATHSCR